MLLRLVLEALQVPLASKEGPQKQARDWYLEDSWALSEGRKGSLVF